VRMGWGEWMRRGEGGKEKVGSEYVIGGIEGFGKEGGDRVGRRLGGRGVRGEKGKRREGKRGI